MKYPFSLSLLQGFAPVVFGVLQAAAFLLRYDIDWLEVALLTIGASIGVALLFVDRLYFHQYYAEPTEQSNGAASTPGLVTRSLLFMLALVPLGLFIISSTGSRLGVGVLLGIVAGLTIEMWRFKDDVELFHRIFLFQLKRRMTPEEVTRMALIALGVLCVSTLLLFR